MPLQEQFHGYKNGHQLLAGNIELSQLDQDAVDRLSDISGQLRPGERFAPYFTTYPLPSLTHYVVALTRQDAEAPRAGCVRTHSLFIPMQQWTASENTQTLSEVLSRFLPGDNSPDPTHAPAETEFWKLPIWPSLEGSWTLELVEALFLERRAPIAVFDTKDAELAGFRLITALWPSLRKSFSICTFALGPRSIKGKPFDLVFAPQTARSRFSDWSGRRIDVTPGSQRPRHHWSKELTEAVFRSPAPSLESLDGLGILGEGQPASEAKFRMALLWNELVEKSMESPESVLGLIDIFNTARPTNLRARESLAREIRAGVQRAKELFPDFQFWQYTIALTQKFANGRLPKGTMTFVRAAVQERAALAPQGCLAAMQQILNESATLPIPLAAAIGDGLGKSGEFEVEILGALGALPPKFGKHIVTASRVLGNRVVSATSEPDSPVLPLLLNFLRLTDPQDRRSLLRRSAGSFKSAAQTPLLDFLLRETTRSTFLIALRVIGQNTSFEVQQFDASWIRTAKATRSILDFRKVLLDPYSGLGASRLMAASMSLAREDIQWLFENVQDDTRRADVLAGLIASASEYDLKQFTEGVAKDFVPLAILAVDLGRYADAIARLLSQASASDEDLCSFGIPLIGLLAPENPAYFALTSKTVRQLLGRPELLDDSALQSIVESLSRAGRDAEIVDSLFSDHDSASAITRALQMYEIGSDDLKSRIHSRIDAVCSRILHSGLYGLSTASIRSLADMLERAGSRNSRGQILACGRVLNACFDAPSLPVGDVVAVAFKVVYQEVKSGSPGFNLLGLFFNDWDHCKTIRRKLVDTYVESIWPPVGLLYCAWRVDDVEKILRYLQNTWRGRDYLRSIRHELNHYDGAHKEALLRALRNFSDIESIYTDDD